MPSTANTDNALPVQRRRILVTALAALGAAMTWRPRLVLAEDSELRAFARRLVQTVGLDDRSLGVKLQRTHADHSLPSIVPRLLSVPKDDWRRFVAATDSELRDRIRANILSDFQNGNTVLVHGWHLSATEFHALTLSSLMDT